MRLTLPLPPSANTLYIKGSHIALSEAHRAWRELCAFVCLAAGVKPTSLVVAVRIDIYRKRRLGDIDNRAKTILDGLNGIAYDAATDRLFVTGKLWPKVFEIAVK